MEEHRRLKWRVVFLHYRVQFVYGKKTARVGGCITGFDSSTELEWGIGEQKNRDFIVG